MERVKRFFRKLGKGLRSKGYTLLEVSAVVAVTGTLAAVAMPVVADKLAASKITAAQQDVQAIKDAVSSFMKDTGIPPFYTAVTSGQAITLPKYTETTLTFYPALKTDDGLDPTTSDATGTAWPALATSGAGTTGSLDGQLIQNAPGYPTKTDNAWKGPYLPSLKKDPWGNKYLVAIKGLAEPGTDKQVYAVFAISAGPNGKIETGFEQVIKTLGATKMDAGSFTVVNDDIVSRIQ